VLGHNLLGHDLPFLAALAPGLRLLKKPVIDTLYLSPLAFPENPYHHLVKDYKLVKDALNDPAADARLAAKLFTDQWQAFTKLAENGPDVASFFRYCLLHGSISDQGQDGMKMLFDALGIRPPPSAEAAAGIFAQQAMNFACISAAKQVATIQIGSKGWLPLAYALAWLRVSGNNSVLPAWTRYQFPAVVKILKALRDTPCDDPACGYCRATHDPAAQLKKFFGYDSFRARPATSDGKSLQEQIVRHGMADKPLLAIMPTGAGKSLCYQLPALVRNFRRGTLTIVISPLQALMKDQVENLSKKTGTNMAGALYGMLTPPERGATLERVRLGDIAILYVSPEQLRNKSFRDVIRNREIGMWVFDEAHCLSKWGHDFRPDYLYASRFIREFADEQKMAIPPVACFTATAKLDVIQEIREHFKTEMGLELEVFSSLDERHNLAFQVQVVSPAEKYERIHGILSEELPSSAAGCAVVYTATRKESEKAAQFLQKKSWEAAAFHAGLDAPVKRQIQDDFIAGKLRAICATNAFGMGIDKDNVRLVIHADIPGSLESYLQEAGRAGRDEQPAKCILLYDENDVETQFSLGALSSLTRQDIAEIWRAIRRAKRNKDGQIVITAGEILREEAIKTSFESTDPGADTKVKTAIALLERHRFLKRDQNRTGVFQARPLVSTIEEAKARIEGLNLSERRQSQWLSVIHRLMNAEADEGMSADEFAEMAAFRPAAAQPAVCESGPTYGAAREYSEGETAYVMRILHEMAEAGLIMKDTLMTAFVRHKVVNPSLGTFEKTCALEAALLGLMQEEAPDPEGWLMLSLRRMNQNLLDKGFHCSPEIIIKLLNSLSRDGKGLAGRMGSLELRYISRDQYRVKIQREWPDLLGFAEKRRAIAGIALRAILTKIPDDAPASAELLVSFSAEDIFKALASDMVVGGQIRDKHAALEHALMYLHDQRVVILQQGLAVFRQAMTISILPESKGRSFTQGEYSSLKEHYKERVFQIHVIAAYAQMALQKLDQAARLVIAYFTMPREDFVKRYFADKREEIERATSAASYRRIVDVLNNSIQTSIVAAHPDRNMLILAGPGSGKTRTVIHRCAYLLRVERVPASAILVLCFNRNACLALRRRLRDLVGPDARGVTVQTYHGLAMRLVGASFTGRNNGSRAERPDFDEMLVQATRLLKGEIDLPGMEPDELRDRLLAGYRHILVDEYQDIDERQYDLVSAIAGRTLQDQDSKLSILAVGDDDQNIYTFRGTNVEFIRKFADDYKAKPHYLVENYRSSGHIVSAANTVIAQNHDRMKLEHPIQINRARQNDPPGGVWTAADPLAHGRVQVITAADLPHQSAAVLSELQRLRGMYSECEWSDFAILGRTAEDLAPVRAFCEHQGIPVVWNADRDKLPSLPRVREIAAYLDVMAEHRSELQRPEALLELLGSASQGDLATRWTALLREMLIEWAEETGNAEQPVQAAMEFLYESLHDQKREPATGKGVFMATVHSAKGMEFPHVFLLGGWQGGSTRAKQEEERRVYYVGMTRAKENLCLFERQDSEASFTRPLQGPAVLRRQAAPTAGLPEEVMRRRYALLTLADYFLDWAGRKPPAHTAHAKLSKLKTGDPLKLRAAGEMIEVVADGTQVGLLSKAGAEAWRPRLDSIEEARVFAMVRRQASDSDAPEHAAKLQAHAWEIPIAEIAYRK